MITTMKKLRLNLIKRNQIIYYHDNCISTGTFPSNLQMKLVGQQWPSTISEDAIRQFNIEEQQQWTTFKTQLLHSRLRLFKADSTQLQASFELYSNPEYVKHQLLELLPTRSWQPNVINGLVLAVSIKYQELINTPDRTFKKSGTTTPTTTDDSMHLDEDTTTKLSMPFSLD